MKNILCSVFGHRPAFGYYGEGEGYLLVKGIGVDGINGHHASLFCSCERCGINYKIGNCHLPEEYVGAFDRDKRRVKTRLGLGSPP